MIDTSTLAVSMTAITIITAVIAGLISGLTGSITTVWLISRHSRRSVADEATAYLRRPTTRLKARLWRGGLR